MDASSFQLVQMVAWRAVEAQHRVSTMILVDTLDEQSLLEDILEASKPALPSATKGLHWLLFTPFRYPPLPGGSRFRSPAGAGVFYASEARKTACAELAYWRWRFLMESELESIDPCQQTLFQTSLSGVGIDLRLPPYVENRMQWIDATDYAPCQALADAARENAVDLIRYESVRDPDAGGCVAVLHPAAFAKLEPTASETWSLFVTRTQVRWKKESIFDDEPGFEFDTTLWRIGKDSAP